MTDIGVTLYHAEEVVAIKKEPDGQVTVSLTHRPPITTTTLMYAIGRIGATKRLSLEEVGIMPDARGRVIVNDHFQTCSPPYLRRRRRHRLSRAGLHLYAARTPCCLPCL